MEATLIYTGQGLHFIGKSDSGHAIAFDSAREVGGTDAAARPMEGLLLSMMACFSADVVSILQKKRKTVTGYQVTAKAQRAEDFPKVFTAVDLHLLVQSSDAQPADVERSIELARTKYCSAMTMFERAGCTITITYELRS